MIVYIRVHKDFKHPSVEIERFQIEADSTSTIEEIKILITLRYVDLGPGDFDLILENKNIRGQSVVKVYEYLENTDDQLHFVMVQKQRQCCCNLF